ncbi:MAG: clan AA aspartic protease [Nevskia sp.]|nr:clan AA aspartic protease [Nevskia sp.]
MNRPSASACTVRSARKQRELPSDDKMGHAYAKITLRNPRKPDLKPVHVTALADTGAFLLCIPQHIALQLELDTADHREVTLADGRTEKFPYVGPIELSFEKRRCFVGAMVMGDETLLGAVPMEDMDLVVAPLRGTVAVNPDSPNLAHLKAK